MLDVNVLRKNGAMISARVSWERSATELIWQLQNNPTFSYLNKVPHILITFAQDGAVYNKLFPDGHLSPIEKERLVHKAFLHSRTNVYIENKENMCRIDTFLQSDSNALVIIGESGLGKSALNTFQFSKPSPHAK